MNRERLLHLWARVRHHHQRLKEAHPGFSKWLRWVLLAPVALLLAAIAFVLLIIVPTLPDISNIQNLVASQSSMILDRDGGVLYAIHGDENRKNVSFDQISPYAVKATLAIEDDRFYQHIGIDTTGILNAICSQIHLCSTPRGGSTITQQFVKNAFLTNERTYTRKIKEIILALELERKFTKNQILEMYLNRIPYGSSIFGVELASEHFFGKSAKDLSIGEAAILASIPKAPSYFSPYGDHRYVTINLDAAEIFKNNIKSEQDLIDANPEFISKGLLGKTYVFEDPSGAEPPRSIYVKGRVDFVLGRMLELKYITAAEASVALAEANAKQFTAFREDIRAPHFVMMIREYLEQKYGKEQLEKGGLRVTTTLDPKLQDAAEAAVAKQADYNEKTLMATNAAQVSMDPDTGQILSMVGSRDYWNTDIDGNVNIALRPRLPGSSFKPIVYAAAFLQGLAPSTVLYDVDTKFGGTYQPDNYDGTFRGPVTIRQALANSLNIPAVKATYLAGVANVLDLARKMGIQLNQPDDWYGLSLGLGAGEVRLLDHVAAYSTFANGGYKVDPVSILKIEDKNGNILEEYQPPAKRDLILDPQVAYLVTDILSDANARPEGYWRGQITIPGQINAAKTGTSNKKINNVNYPFDTWTMGYTRHLAAGVWVGNADGAKLASKADGLGAASPIWLNFMIEATKGQPAVPFDKPEGIKYVKISKRSGLLPSEFTPPEDLDTGVFASFSVPQQTDPYKVVEIDKVSGKLATEFTPESARVKKGFYEIHSEEPDNPLWEQPVQDWADKNDQSAKPPTEYDTVHTAENTRQKPEILITSPTAQSTVSPPYIGVWADIKSAGGVSSVEYYWDDVLMDTAQKAPFKGQIRVSGVNAEPGSVHVIKAIAYDDLYNSNQASVEVKIGSDTTPPNVSFAFPENGASLTTGNATSAQVNAVDPNGDIAKVDLAVDGQTLSTLKAAPYVWQFNVPDTAGEHTLKATAYDYAGNPASASITIHVSAGDGVVSGDTSEILSPAANASLNQGVSGTIKVVLDKEAQENLRQVSVLGKKQNDRPFEIASAPGLGDGTDPRNYTFIWANPEAGQYELSLKITLQDGRVRFSGKVPVVVR